MSSKWLQILWSNFYFIFFILNNRPVAFFYYIPLFSTSFSYLFYFVFFLMKNTSIWTTHLFFDMINVFSSLITTLAWTYNKTTKEFKTLVYWCLFFFPWALINFLHQMTYKKLRFICNHYINFIPQTLTLSLIIKDLLTQWNECHWSVGKIK